MLELAKVLVRPEVATLVRNQSEHNLVPFVKLKVVNVRNLRNSR